MNTHRAARFFLAFMASALALCQPGWAQSSAVLRLEAIDRTGTLGEHPETELFLGAGFNGWNPAGTAQSDWLEGHDGERIGWVFEIPRALVEIGGQFKFTRGTWGTVECAAIGAPIENRRTGVPDWAGENPTMRFEVMGFEDQLRGKIPESAGTVTGGTLEIWITHSEILDEDRTVRVWLPEAYTKDPDAEFSVFYFHDGQNMFDARTSAFGVEWEADEAMTGLFELGESRPWILVGIDNSGVNRSRDYLPFKAGGDYNSMPSGGGDDYLGFLIDELMPEIARRYRVLIGPEHTGLGGSSFGGVITLHAIMSRPGVFGITLVESPSLWVGDGRLMKAIKNHEGGWPDRVYLGMGDAETGRQDRDRQLVELVRAVGSILENRDLGPDRLRVIIGSGHRHNEAAWQARLPQAFRFLLGDEAEETKKINSEP